MEPSVDKPKYRSVFEHLRGEILSGQYRAGQKFPSEAALVKRFEASRITVGRAMRELQHSGLIDRIAGSGTYVKALPDERRDALLFGLIIPNLGETEIFEPICHAIAACPAARSHALLWAHSDSSGSSQEEEVIQLCDQCLARGVSGVFFAPVELTARSHEVNQRVLKRLKDAGVPAVLLDRRPDQTSPRGHYDLVGIDNHRAGYLATDHLLRLGAQRVGFLAYRYQASTVKTRIQGYKDALAACEGYQGGDRVFHLSPSSPMELPPEAFDCDAFVCANDRIAGNLMHLLLGRGLRIPEDVRIVGIDDVNYAALLPVPLTTVHQPCRDIGETALRTMLERLERPRMPARDILLDCTLAIRKSCGAEQAGLELRHPNRGAPYDTRRTPDVD